MDSGNPEKTAFGLAEFDGSDEPSLIIKVKKDLRCLLKPRCVNMSTKVYTGTAKQLIL